MSAHSSHTNALIQEVIDAAKALPSDVSQDDQARKRLKLATDQLSGALETPVDGMRRIGFQVTYWRTFSRLYLADSMESNLVFILKAQYLPIVRIAIEGGWFRALTEGDGPKTAAELAKATGADESLIGEF